MTLGAVIGIAAIGLLVFSMILFPKQWKGVGVLVGGFFGNFVQDTAKTPEGARAIFQQKIEEVQDNYNRASDTLSKLSGKLELAKQNLAKKKNDIATVEKQCEALVKAGKIEQANVLAEQREAILIEIRNQEELVEKLVPMVEEARGICLHNERQLKTLKTKSKEIIAGLELNKQLSDMYDDMNELKNVRQTDKLLASVEEGYIDSKQKAIGSKVVHDNKLETKANKAKLEADKLTTNSYIADLQKKYNKIGVR